MTGSTDVPDWAREVRRLVVLSGAGISTESGIPDYRGPNGAWTKDPAARFRNTYQAFLADPALRVEYWRSRLESEVWAAEPNAGHRAVAAVLASGIDTTVITQNTDGLHQLGGVPAERVIELHGTMLVTECVSCERRVPTKQVLARIDAVEVDPACESCGGVLKTASTMFGQTMPTDVFARATDAVTGCDLVLAVGTSLVIEPAGSLCATAVQAGATLVIATLESTPYDGIATELVREPLGEALPRIAEQLRTGLSLPRTHPDEGADADLPTGPAAVRPRALLQPGHRTAPLRGRSAELDRLTSWCDGSGGRVHLVSGPAGTGKSRLAVELADRVQHRRPVLLLGPGEGPEALPPGPSLVVVDDAETRAQQVRAVVRAVEEHPDVRVLLLARARPAWWDELRPPATSEEELVAPAPDGSHDVEDHEALVAAYVAALARVGATAPVLPPTTGNGGPATSPYEQQVEVLAGLLGLPEPAHEQVVHQELTHLRASAADHGLELSTGAVRGAVVTALLCGATDETAAVGVLGHLTELQDPDTRLRAARWLHAVLPPDGQGFWTSGLPGVLDEDLIASSSSSKLLVAIFSETTPEQELRALTVLARASSTRPVLRERLAELLSVLPGVSPSAVGAALHGGYPEPLADALVALTRNAALPAHLLESVPPGTVVLGEFPVLLAASLAEAYEHRARSRPETALPWLTDMQVELADRLLDLGRLEEGREVAELAVQNADRLDGRPDRQDRAARVLRRAHGAAGQGPGQGPAHDGARG